MVLTADIIGFGTLASTLVALVIFTLTQSRHNESKRKGIYNRLDQDRGFNSDTYVRQDIHDTQYQHMKADVTEIKSDVKKILIKNGIR